MQDDNTVDEVVGALSGCINWIDALLCLIEDTDCNPDNPEQFDEILLCSALMRNSASEILKKYKENNDAI